MPLTFVFLLDCLLNACFFSLVSSDARLNSHLDNSSFLVFISHLQLAVSSVVVLYLSLLYIVFLVVVLCMCTSESYFSFEVMGYH